MILGKNVTVHSRSSFSAGKVFNNPIFEVGDNTYLGPGLSISVAKKISIGTNCHIASDVTIMDNDGHPLDPTKRANHEPIEKENALPVVVGNNVWIGNNVLILKGVTIHECSVIAAQSVVVKDVGPYSVFAGNPAQLVKKLQTTKINGGVVAS